MTTSADTTLGEHLERAARYRLLHLLVRPPVPGRREEIEAVGREIPGLGLEPLIAASDEEAAAEAFRLLGQAGSVSACASDYVEDGYADKGPFLADVAGFYRAFGFTPTLAENPDHFAAMFEFLSFLALKQAWAGREGDEEQREIAADAEAKLLAERVRPYLSRFSERLLAAAPPGGAFEAVARHVAMTAG
ncbi:MAG: molecular chaperone TorD family protein [Planctomycetota bacterium]